MKEKSEVSEMSYICIYYDGPRGKFPEVCKGHIDVHDFMELCADQGIEFGYEPDIEHCFARWIPDATGEHDLIIRFETESKRGNFPVTKTLGGW